MEFNYKDIKIISTKQVEAIVSSVNISHEKTTKGIKLKLTWV